uniref:Uncharacterized protein n=1 Tax=Brassica oleracea TaxID=3712 RepID=A0A3P6F0U6_BRAOL|nr:unnamed protein product [Brassica oleracea]
MIFSVKVSWAPRSRVLLLTPSTTVLMPLRLCLRHCASNYYACVSSFMFWESRNTRKAVISWASTCSSSIISVWGIRGSSLRQELVNTVLLQPLCVPSMV